MDSSKVFWFGTSAGLSVSCLLFMGLYGLYLFWLKRESVYLLYALYCVFSDLYILPSIIEFLYGINLYHFDSVSFGPLRRNILISFEPFLRVITNVLYSIFIIRIVEPNHSARFWCSLITFLIVYAGISLYFQFDLSLTEDIGNFIYHKIGLPSYLFLFVLDSPTIFLLCFLLIIVWYDKSAFKGYLMGMIVLNLTTLLVMLTTYFLINYRLNYFNSGYYVPVEKLTKPYLNSIPYMSFALQGFCFTLALAYRSLLIERDNTAIRATYTEQLEQELSQRTQELRAQERLLEEERFRQLEETFEHKQAETEMAALRAQMNPHFIFNCLNAIKYYSTDNESSKATEYLTKFAKLVRLVLENSRSNRVTLNDELQALELYLEMETMRFGSKLTFQIEIDPAIDSEFVEIPPLLIQPYVENAIWHGLMHKEKGGTVWVRVEQPQENGLLITIKDDGVGRAKATELKSKSAIQHKSFGMKITSERIELINQMYHTQAQVQIRDMTDAMGQPIGTEVILHIPI